VIAGGSIAQLREILGHSTMQVTVGPAWDQDGSTVVEKAG
jgi:hypothetical protein